ncbi:MAG: hypothetical protein ABIN74_05065 [Ferruginibacter sp.]
MSSQNIFIHPSATLVYHRVRIKQIKNSAFYAGAMADHYRALFEKRCKGRLLCRAAFAWIKWKHFEKEYLRLTVNEMLEHRNIKLMP